MISDLAAIIAEILAEIRAIGEELSLFCWAMDKPQRDEFRVVMLRLRDRLVALSSHRQGQEARPNCENGDCQDHYGDRAAWCQRCLAAVLETTEIQWRPMETAPKDGTRIIMLVGKPPYRRAMDGYWSRVDGWTLCGATHWMPLPDPPLARPPQEPE